MTASFTIPEQAYEGLIDLIDMGQEKLDQLAAQIADRELSLDLDLLLADLADAIQYDEKRVRRAVLTVLIPLSGIRADFRMEAREFVDLVAKQIERENAKWHEMYHARLSELTPAIARLIAPNGYFGLIQKAFQLFANRPCVV